MAEIKALKGLCFTQKAGEIAELTCPPYDIISEEERRAYLARNPYNVIRLELPREGDDPYIQAGETLRQWCGQGIMARDETEQIYIYEEEFESAGQTHRLKGFICLVELTPFSEGVVLPHEFTLSKAKTDRLHLMEATACNFSQIYSLYMDDGSTRPLIDRLSSGAPRHSFADASGVIHRFWAVHDPAAEAVLKNQFENRKLYIADGHHRYETALNYRDSRRAQGKAAPGDGCDAVMMMLVDMENPGLVVLPTHRVLHSLPEFDAEKAIARCRPQFDIQEEDSLPALLQALETAYQENRHAFGFYAGGTRYLLLTLRDTEVMDAMLPDVSAVSRQLDVTILHTLVLERIFEVDRENMAGQKNLTYVKAAEDAVEAVQKGQAQCTFLLNPTRVSEIRDVAAAGEKMPQKSTYFYPKLITGLVMNSMADA